MGGHWARRILGETSRWEKRSRCIIGGGNTQRPRPGISAERAEAHMWGFRARGPPPRAAAAAAALAGRAGRAGSIAPAPRRGARGQRAAIKRGREHACAHARRGALHPRTKTDSIARATFPPAANAAASCRAQASLMVGAIASSAASTSCQLRTTWMFGCSELRGCGQGAQRKRRGARPSARQHEPSR